MAVGHAFYPVKRNGIGDRQHARDFVEMWRDAEGEGNHALTDPEAVISH
jgi:hypothetical protein